MKMRTHDGAEEHLAQIEARVEATLPKLATKSDIAGLKWAIGFLGVVLWVESVPLSS